MRIVESCRWLAESVEPSTAAPIVPQVSIVRQTRETPSAWTAPIGPLWQGTQDEQRQVLAQQFSPFIQRWVEGYEEVGGRDVYLWRWCLHGLEITTLSCVDSALLRRTCARRSCWP